MCQWQVSYSQQIRQHGAIYLPQAMCFVPSALQCRHQGNSRNHIAMTTENALRGAGDWGQIGGRGRIATKI